MTPPVRRTFRGESHQVARAREFVSYVIGRRCPVLDEAILLTSEPCTNSLQHTASGRGGSFEVTVYRGPESLRVEVRDDGSKAVPGIRQFENLPEGGRGLELVNLTAARWGQNGDEYGRCIFFELRWKPTMNGHPASNHTPDLRELAQTHPPAHDPRLALQCGQHWHSREAR